MSGTYVTYVHCYLSRRPTVQKHDSESLAHEERVLFKLHQKVVANLTGGVGNGDLGTLGLLLGDLGLTAGSRGGALYIITVEVKKERLSVSCIVKMCSAYNIKEKNKKEKNTHLGLLSLLLGILLLLLVLAIAESGGTGSSTDLGLLVALGTDGLPGGTDDSTLVLDGAAVTLLGNLLGDTLLVHATEENGPGDLAGVLALKEKGLGLTVDETERLLGGVVAR